MAGKPKIEDSSRTDFYKSKKADRNLEKKYSKEFVITYVGNTSKRRGLLTW